MGRVLLYEGEEARAARVFREVLAQAAADDLALRSEAEQALATVLFFAKRRLPAAARHARDAVRLAEQLGDGRALGVALGQQAVIATARGEPRAEALFRRALALPAADYQMVIQEPSYVFCDLLVRADRFEEARRRLAAARAQALTSGDESSLAIIFGDIGVLEVLAGRWTTAAAALEEGYENAVQTGQRPAAAYVLGTRALLAAHRGRAEQAHSDANEALALATPEAMLARVLAHWARGLLALARDDPEAAVQELQPLGERLRAGRVREPGDMRFVPDCAEALGRLGRRSEALALLDWHEGNATRLGRTSALAAVRRCRGLIAFADGDQDRALRDLENAYRLQRATPLPFEQARTALELGVLLRRMRRVRAARDRLGEARASFERLGAHDWIARSLAELAHIGGRARSRSALTPAEERVARLVATGRTNREVARALFLADRTVESHLSHIYAKLGLRSRTELARRLPGER
jgi:DNA-binding CsgD family transcriptional regulator